MPLFGRTTELALAHKLLQQGERLLTFRGSPGIGKSTTANALRLRLPPNRSKKVISFGDASDRVEFLLTLARGVGLETRSGNPHVLLDRIVEHLDLSTHPLFWDDVDHALELARDVVSDLLDAVPGLTLVLAARSRLGLSAEHVITLAPLSPVDAALLFRDRMTRGGTYASASGEEISLLCARAGHLPLAIEILAARVATLGPGAVLQALEGGDLQLDALDRSLDGSWSLLSSEEQRAFALLSVFPSHFSVEAGRSVIGPRGLPILDTLISSSLLVHTVHGARAQTLMLEGVRQYARRRAEELGLKETAHELHCTYYTSIIAPPSDHLTGWTRLDEERENLFSAWAWAIQEDPVSARLLAVAIGLLLLTHGPAIPHRHMLVETLATYERGDPDVALNREAMATKVEILLALGRIDAQTGKNGLATSSFQEARRLAEEISDPSRASTAAALLAFCLRPLGRYDEARAMGQLAFDFATQPGRERLLGATEQSLGMIALATDRPQDAVEHFRRGLALGRAAEAPRLEGIALANLALAYQAIHQWEEARALLHQATARFAEVHDHFHLARVRAHEGVLLAEQGRFDEANVVLEDGYKAVLDQGDLEGELEVLAGRVLVAIGRGEKLLAERRLDDLALASRRTDEVSWESRIAKLRAAIARSGQVEGLCVRLSRDGRKLHMGLEEVDLRRRGPLRLLLLALVEARVSSPGTLLTVDALREAGWPNEKMRADSGTARVYMAIRRLRSLGFESLLRTFDEGYALEAAADIDWSDD